MAGKAPDPARIPSPGGTELLSGPPALRYIVQTGTSEDRRRRFAAVTGIDWRLWILVPLAMAISALVWSVAVAIIAIISNGLWFDWLGAMHLAVISLRFTLPPALICWLLMRALCWRVGVPEYMTAIVSGTVAGWGTIGFGLLGAPLHVMALASIPNAVGGMIAAALVYWGGWHRMRE